MDTRLIARHVCGSDVMMSMITSRGRSPNDDMSICGTFVEFSFTATQNNGEPEILQSLQQQGRLVATIVTAIRIIVSIPTAFTVIGDDSRSIMVAVPLSMMAPFTITANINNSRSVVIAV